jgi:glycosyltransferase involved in cell wall biosynthesis
MCWGFPVACTRESGYTEEDFYYLDPEDDQANIEQINRIQALPENELIEISRKNRKIVETNYNWDNLLSNLGENM